MPDNKSQPPEWYTRVLRVSAERKKSKLRTRGRDSRETESESESESEYVRPEDFDEDLSDTVQESDESDCTFECRCDKPESECECDMTSKHSYEGEDADYYYELKSEREERKWELKERRDPDARAKERKLSTHKSKVKEVMNAYRGLEEATAQGEPSPPISIFSTPEADKICPVPIDAKIYDLYSVDYVENCYDRDTAYYRGSWNYVEFYPLAPDDPPPKKRRRHRKRQNQARTDQKTVGHIYVSPASDFGFRPFRAPEHASLQKHRFEGHDDEEVTIQIISQKYLIIQVSRDMVAKHERYQQVPQSAPKVFEFVGIYRNMKKRCEEMIANLPPSPHETYFEMNHSMGWWNQGGY
ncbi:hypothetical protein F5B20DRAFT_545957 [Whalleya microplaca]|nr:hypothetical protein F5B20DRAFT_545957 [Whalleya microplaca]